MAETHSVVKLTLEGAQKVLAAVLNEAKARNEEMSVCVVDADGYPIAFARTDKAPLTTIAMAQNKARCAAYTAFPTGKLSYAGIERSDFHALSITLAAGAEDLVTIQGGVPIVINGDCIGGVAVGGSGPSDAEIALVGALALAWATEAKLNA